MSDSAQLPFALYRQGKVRDVFDLGDRLLMVATDRISAFDVVLPSAIPGKGELLTAISSFWFDVTEAVVPNHRTGEDLSSLGLTEEQETQLAGRSMIVSRAERIDVECVVRARLAGSGWKEYQRHGTLAGEPLPEGMQRVDALPELRFTPAVKNDTGHDENISLSHLRNLVGTTMANRLEQVSREIFELAVPIADRAGFTLADTKLEFGMVQGELTLIDEVLTPDSSRYWDNATWVQGDEPPGFDKQPVRDWLESSGWNKEPPGPALPDGVIAATRRRYEQVLTRLLETREKPIAIHE